MLSNRLDPGIFTWTTRLTPPKSIKGLVFLENELLFGMDSKREEVEAKILKLRRKRDRLELDINVETNLNVKAAKIQLRKDLKKEIKKLIKSLPGLGGKICWTVMKPECLDSD